MSSAFPRSPVRKILSALTLGLALGLVYAPVVSAEEWDNHDRGREHDHGWKGNKHHRPHNQRRDYDYGYQQEMRRSYTYAQPVYVPPPVYYEPRQSPGVTLFFPLDLRR